MRRSLEILGVVPGFYLHAEADEAADRVVQASYPEQVSLGDVTKITEKQIAGIVRQHPLITHVVHGTGPPCQQVSGLNACGADVAGDRSGLASDELPRIRALLRRASPDCEHADMCETVASLSREDQETYNTVNNGLPVQMCPSGFNWVRRPRLFWPSWELQLDNDGRVEQTDRWTTWHLNATRMPMRRWLKRAGVLKATLRPS